MTRSGHSFLPCLLARLRIRIRRRLALADLRRVLRVAALLLAGLAGPGHGAEPDAALTLRLEGVPSQRITIQVQVDGSPAVQRWEEAFARLFSFCDRNDNEQLEPQEAAWLPTPWALRNQAISPVAAAITAGVDLASLDADGDGAGSVTEMFAFYRHHGAGHAVVTAGQCHLSEQLTKAILRQLDKEAETASWEGARAFPKTPLGAVDLDGNRQISPQELRRGITYPSTSANRPWPSTANHDRLRDILQVRLPPIHSAPREAESVASESLSGPPLTPTARGESEQKEPLRGQLAGFQSGSRLASHSVTIHFSKGEGELAWADQPPTGRACCLLDHERLRIDAWADRGQHGQLWERHRAKLGAVFTEADQDEDQRLSPQELTRAAAVLPRTLRGTVDTDQDGQLLHREWETWLDLQEVLQQSSVQIRVLYFPAGLFETIDRNCDGQLSIRERRGPCRDAARLPPGEDDQRLAGRWPQHVRLIICRGRPSSLLAPQLAPGPVWFTALDRNRDGDVSWAEFAGSRKTFERLDRNADGLLSASEAEEDRF